jgi:hypothetical protein
MSLSRALRAEASCIEVSPDALHETADLLRAAVTDARRVRRDLADAGVAVTGSQELSVALSGHADSWGWSLDLLHERVQSVARTLDAAAASYDQVEQHVARPSQR